MPTTVSWPSQTTVDAYVASRAAALGIDPSVAVTVRRAESQAGFVGDHGTSFGPFQLHYNGGLGDVFTQHTGLDARDPQNWQASTDFALQWAKTHGWGDFHAAEKAGISIWQGIGQAVGIVAGALSYFFPITGYTGDPSKTYHTPGASDLFAPVGTAIRNIVQGRITALGSNGPGGNNLLIHGDDGRDYYYAHMKDAPKFDVGQYLPGGIKIGEVGKTGNAENSDPHVHIGIGYGIESGTGPNGGAGKGFSAQSFLTNLLHLGGAKDDPVYETPTMNPGDLTGAIKSGIVGGLDYVHQGIIDYVQNRAAAMVLLIAGIFLIAIGVWQTFNRVPIVRDAIKTTQTAVGTAAMLA